jgi:hypothetical protein
MVNSIKLNTIRDLRILKLEAEERCRQFINKEMKDLQKVTETAAKPKIRVLDISTLDQKAYIIEKFEFEINMML